MSDDGDAIRPSPPVRRLTRPPRPTAATHRAPAAVREAPSAGSAVTATGNGRVHGATSGLAAAKRRRHAVIDPPLDPELTPGAKIVAQIVSYYAQLKLSVGRPFAVVFSEN